MTKELRERLNDLETEISRLPSPDPPPRTTLQIQDLAHSESAWQNYLQYFLDPTANHGMGNDALARFLRGLNEETPGDLPNHPADDIVVESEESSPAGNRPDIVIYEPQEFFICCELKLYALEGADQTVRYVGDEHVGNLRKDEFPEIGRHYIYIKRPDYPDPEAEEFLEVTWLQVKEWLRPLLLDERGRYPARTTAQLADFLDTITQDMTADEHLETAQKKMQVYFNHQEAIREAKAGLDTVHEHAKQNWHRRFVNEHLPSTWTDEWHYNSNIYGQFYHSKWEQDEELEVDDADIELHFVHLIRDLESFEEGKLTVQLRWPGGSSYREQFKDLFVSHRFANDLDPLLAEHDIEKRADYSYTNPRFTEKVYPVVKSDLPRSYYETLSRAVTEHQQLAPVINEILETAIQSVESNESY